VHALQVAYPDHDILLTHMTPTGRATGRELFGDSVIQAYLPYDYPSAVARFLDHYRPRFGALVDTEVWPNLIDACRARGVPLHLVNARLSEKSLRSDLRVESLSREAFGALHGVAAQSVADANRLRRIGAVAHRLA
jgi:3-deoxy-D-manno-octulosonic-acid transferase